MFGYLKLYGGIIMNNELPWDKPRIKRIVELFCGKVLNIKKISSIREVNRDEIQR